MQKDELLKLLEQLHQEIEEADTVDEKGRELLSELQDEISDLLQRSEHAPAEPGMQVSRRVEDSIEYFEVTHPQLTVTLSQLLAVLSNAGI